MKKIPRSIIASLLVLCCAMPEAHAETFVKVDLTTSNIVLTGAAIYGSYYINKAANKPPKDGPEFDYKTTKRGFIIDNYLTMTAVSADMDNYPRLWIGSNSSKKIESLYAFKFPDIINGLGTGLKLGYRKPYHSFFKAWALYGSLHVRYNHFYLDMRENTNLIETVGNSMLRLSPGAGINIELGNPRSPVSLRLDFNLRYDIPVFYSGRFGDGADCLNSGLSPYFGFIIGGPRLKQLGMNVGLFVEAPSYDLFKPSDYFVEPYSAHMFTFGINFSIFPY